MTTALVFLTDEAAVSHIMAHIVGGDGARVVSDGDALNAINFLHGRLLDARTVMLTGVDIMSPDQVGEWLGVRSWLEQG